MVIPLSVVLLAMFNLALNLVVVLIFGWIQGVRPMLSWLELPLIIGLLTVLTTGVSMLLASLFVTLRDVQPIWEVVAQILFYASPVIVPLETVQTKLASTPWLVHLYMCNPLATILQQFRHAMVNPAAPSAASALGGQALLLVPIAISFAIFALGFVVFNRSAPTVAENL